MIVVRCKQCNKEISSLENQTRRCGCPNMMTVTGDILTASDLSKTIVVSRTQEEEKDKLTTQDLQWQEQRRKRKVRKLDFEIR